MDELQSILTGTAVSSSNVVIDSVVKEGKLPWCFFIFKKKKNTEFGSVEILSNSCILPVTSYDNLHRESKKTSHQTLGHNFTNYYPILRIFFTSRLGSKFATNSCLNIPPHFKHVATLPCEIWMQKNGIIPKYILQLMMNHKVV